MVSQKTKNVEPEPERIDNQTKILAGISKSEREKNARINTQPHRFKRRSKIVLNNVSRKNRYLL